ncbi:MULTISPECIES: MarR family winged helix-turn-helix transcriptional regulator [unclassified Bacillus (in: firmicutes)]|uniref:MarR family winged helix-turn-helix transcriptional regulator n=1 Tax=unclassified Bacillus (in: firmicutes) TaxID=185979 RepID=UPI0008E6EFA8|nr:MULTISPECIES: MarR family transcriptional regulator [unclassified Bacillus (in: firmicutes)]SFA86592.1 DNA-binding transcriptional regulator, MarR family [Bacillus sp. UNCCL13]SFQ83761.1 DNA-binding transcriptional regulator, MarR family [Bacillus sp. cl95]
MNQTDILELRSKVQKFIRLFGLLEQTVTPCGFKLSPSQVFALQELEDNTLTIGDLADKLLLERSSVSRLVDALVKGGFVNRSLNEENRREVLLSLTEKGMRSVQQVKERSIEYYRSILNEVSEVEQQQILCGFNLFTNALSKKGSNTNEL